MSLLVGRDYARMQPAATTDGRERARAPSSPRTGRFGPERSPARRERAGATYVELRARPVRRSGDRPRTERRPRGADTRTRDERRFAAAGSGRAGGPAASAGAMRSKYLGRGQHMPCARAHTISPYPSLD